jgi:hypothetical protein
MERIYALYALGPPDALAFVTATTIVAREWDFDVDRSMVEELFAKLSRTATGGRCCGDRAGSSLDGVGTGNGRSVG